jgi:hypothetical protein
MNLRDELVMKNVFVLALFAECQLNIVRNRRRTGNGNVELKRDNEIRR